MLNEKNKLEWFRASRNFFAGYKGRHAIKRLKKITTGLHWDTRLRHPRHHKYLGKINYPRGSRHFVAASDDLPF